MVDKKVVGAGTVVVAVAVEVEVVVDNSYLVVEVVIDVVAAETVLPVHFDIVVPLVVVGIAVAPAYFGVVAVRT